MRDETLALSSRTVQRRFLHATGISHRTARQIERARRAVTLLRDGASILDDGRAGRATLTNRT